ncbi:MAG: ion channel [Bacteroidota bacterium]
MKLYNKTGDPGLGTRFNNDASRLINEDGSINVIRKGTKAGANDIYNHLVTIGWWKFNFYVLIYFVALNVVFALAFMLAGLENITGIKISESGFENFMNAFYFSAQTFTSVGYGYYSPSGHAAHIIATFEVMFGLMSFAVASGLLYGRFSKPHAKFSYSKNALIAPYEEGKGLMFRVANLRKNMVTEVTAMVLLTMNEKNDAGEIRREYYRLDLEIEKITFFPISWTIVHPVNENSPFYNRSVEDLVKNNAEILILLKGYDETFSQEVVSRKSYIAAELVWNAKFEKMFSTNENGQVIADLEKISMYSEVN